MFKHYLATALRHFRRFRFATLANVLCLACGLACLVVTYAVITFISKSDMHLPNAGRIQVITEDLNAPAVGARFKDLPLTGPIVAKMIEADFPQLEAVARRTDTQVLPVSTGETSRFASVSYADAKFLDIFALPSISGAGPEALRTPHSAVIVKHAAQKIFGTTAVVGRTLRLANREDVTIVGVLAEIPEPTRLGFEILASMDVHDAMLPPEGAGEDFSNWMWLRDGYYTYVLLPANGSLTARDFVERLKSFSARRVPKHDGGNTIVIGAVSPGDVFMNLMTAQLGAFAHVGISAPTLGYLLGGLILIIACLNYANLAAALASLRAREVGLRKVIGAARGQVLLQHLFEACLMGVAALALTLLLAALMVPMVKRMGFDITANVLLQPGFGGLLLVLIAFVTIVGGLYPALILSSIRPNQALRMGANRSGKRLISALMVVGQFAASSFLLIAVLVMNAQNGRVLKLESSLTEDPTVVIRSRIEVAKVDLQALRNRLLESPFVKSVSASSTLPMSLVGSPLPVSRSPNPGGAPISTAINNVSYDFFSTVGIAIVAGRDFSRQHGEDISRGWKADRPQHVVVDERFTRQMGWASPAAAIGKTAYMPYGSSAFPMEIIGVVKDKPLQLMSMGTGSSAYFLSPRAAGFPVIRISRDNVSAALAHIDAVWKELSPNVPGERRFMDELFEQTYRTLRIVSVLITSLAVFGCIIAAIGLFGMAVHIIDRRTHEMGVRKTLGAHSRQVAVLLLKDFSKPVLIANLVAWPLAFIALRIYLRMFAERVALTPAPFMLGLAITLVIAWLAVGSRVHRAANIKPADVLRYE